MTDKQIKFCDEYMIDYNATAAAIRAGYSPKTAKEQGHKLVNISSLKEEIDRRRAELSKACGVSAERVMEEIALLAFYDPTKIFDPLTHEVLEPYGKCIKSIWTGKKGTKYEFYDRQKSLDMLAKIHGMYVNDQTINLKSDEGITGIVMLPETKKEDKMEE